MASAHPLQVQLTWVGTEDVPIMFISHTIGQVDDRGDAILSFGQVTPPALLGTPDEVAEQVKRLAFVPVTPVARFSMSRPRLIELMQMIDQLLKNQEAARQAIRQAGQGDML